MSELIVVRIIYCPDIMFFLPSDISPEYPYHVISETLKIEYRILQLGDCQAILRICNALFGQDINRHILLYNITDKIQLTSNVQTPSINPTTLWNAMKAFILKEEIAYSDDIVEYVKSIKEEKLTQVRFSNEREHSNLRFVLNLFGLQSFTALH